MAETQSGQSSATPTRHAAVTPSDATVFDPRPRYILCLTAGNCIVDDELNVSITYPMIAFQRLEFRAKRVKVASTGTYVLQY